EELGALPLRLSGHRPGGDRVPRAGREPRGPGEFSLYARQAGPPPAPAARPHALIAGGVLLKEVAAPGRFKPDPSSALLSSRKRWPRPSAPALSPMPRRNGVPQWRLP